MTAKRILTLSCRDTVGIVAAIASFLAGRGEFITESQQYADLEMGRFFMRVAYDTASGDLASDKAAFDAVATQFGLDWTMVDPAIPMRVVIAASRFGHCLNDLLHRWRTSTLPVEISAVVSNHEDLRGLVEWHGVDFVHLPVTADTRPVQEQELLDLIDQRGSEMLILARYMQVLSADLCTRLAGRCINIHHSFLPSFRGAKPYHQAHQRGVKLIGATAHFVTADLDEGPIIEQAIERIDHSTSADAMVAVGRDAESIVLARAVTWAAERRILLTGSKTVVFRR
jgi:formyltetrahydrofolate deformylase